MAALTVIPDSKPLEHLSVKWTISNFSFSESSDYSLRSSIFTANTVIPTNWYLGLELKHLDWGSKKPMYSELHTVRIHLIRIGYKNQSRKSIRGTVRFGFLTEKGSVSWYPGNFSYPLGLGCVYSSSTDFCQRFSKNRFTFLCDLILYNDDEKISGPVNFRMPDARNLLRMPLYLEKLSHKRNSYDVKIKTSDGQVMAHEGVLKARSHVFRRMLSDPANKSVDVSYAKTLVMQQFLLYLYLNSLDYYTDTYSSFDLLDLAMKFQVDDLVMLLLPKDIHLRTEAGGGDCAFIWRIQNFSHLQPKKIHQSQIVSANFNKDLTYRLKLFQNQFKIGIYMETIEGNPDLDVNVKISARDKNGADVALQTFSFVFSEKSVVGSSDFIIKDKKEKYKEILDGDSLTISCEVSYSDLIFKNSVDHTGNYENSSIVPEDDLSKRFAELLKKESETDLIVRVGARDFLVHKAILRARSNSFASMLSDLKPSEENVLIINNISESSMELILQYIYTGKLHVDDYELGLQIYEDSYKLDVDLLRVVVVQMLKFFISPKFAIDAFLRTHDFNDADFKHYVLEFICSQAPMILLTEKWQNMKDHHPELQQVVTKALGSGYRVNNKKKKS